MKEALAACPAHKRIAVYQRVSSETQRERETIKTQGEALDRAVNAATDVQVTDTYVDDGVSGTVPLSHRPQGARLMADAARGLFDEVWCYRYDRLARDEIESLVLRRELTSLDVRLYSVSEGYSGDLLYGIQAVMAGEERRVFLARSAEGMNRAAKEGRYTGGIAPYGYRVEGHKNTSRLVPADDDLPGQVMTEAQVIRHIYARLAGDGWTCRRIADELNALGVPTKYTLEGRGLRGRRTQGTWGAGRIRNMVVSPTYKGVQEYGKRTTKPRDVITAQVPAPVAEEVWQAAQETLSRNRAMPKNTPRIYLLRGVVTCAECGRAFCGSQSHGAAWYRCNGTLRRADLLGPRCRAKGVKGDYLEPVIWSDIERFLRDPGDILAELEHEVESDPVREALARERDRYEAAQSEWQARRERLLDLYEQGHVTKEEFGKRMDPITASLVQCENRLAEIREREDEGVPDPPSADLLARIRERLDEGLTDEERTHIVRLLCSVTVSTNVDDQGKKTQRALVTYRFPGGGLTFTDKPAGQNYTTRIYRRVIHLPSGRQKKAVTP